MKSLECSKMPTFVTHKISPQLYEKARNFFLQQGRSDFLAKSIPSLCTRYLIAKIVQQAGYPDFFPEDQCFHIEDLRYSASHRGDWILIGFHQNKIALDLEQIKTQSPEYYQERCCKETLIKYLDLDLDQEAKIQIKEKKADSYVLQYQGKSFEIATRTITDWAVAWMPKEHTVLPENLCFDPYNI